jgi:transposase
MVWGCMGYAGVGELAIVEGIMNAKGYVNILLGNLKNNVRKLGIQDLYLFQQDNDPKHTRITREWLLYNARGLLETPPKSPDINPIETLWSLLENKKSTKCKCSSRQMLIENLKKEKETLLIRCLENFRQ